VSAPRRLAHDWFSRALPDNVAIGDGSFLHSSFAFLHCRSRRQPLAVTVGRSSGVYRGSHFDLGPRGRVDIGDYSALVGVIIATNGRVTIGDYCFLAHEVVIADAAVAIPWRSDAAAEAHDARGEQGNASDDDGDLADEAPAISLGDDVWVGAGAVLLRGAHIGNGAVVGAAAVVDFAVPDRAVVVGNPARIVGDAGGSRDPPLAWAPQ
jgi:acetyltransferase-like isoleucine patch superfamily enzyme